MNCANHADVENTAYCIKCGKPLCAECVRQVQASVYCESCLAEGLAANAAPTPPKPQTTQLLGGSSPEAAFLLGLIPGVGAIYNAEYFKAALHLLIFGTLVTLADSVGGSGEMLFGLLAFGFYAYMPFEAYYTAKKRKLAREGINLITPFDQFNEQFGEFKNSELWGGIALVAIGALFLLDNFDIVPLHQVGRFWPALLILAGIFLITRFQKGKNV
jgi:hypothetical protein